MCVTASQVGNEPLPVDTLRQLYLVWGSGFGVWDLGSWIWGFNSTYPHAAVATGKRRKQANIMPISYTELKGTDESCSRIDPASFCQPGWIGMKYAPPRDWLQLTLDRESGQTQPAPSRRARRQRLRDGPSSSGKTEAWSCASHAPESVYCRFRRCAA